MIITYAIYSFMLHTHTQMVHGRISYIVYIRYTTSTRHTTHTHEQRASKPKAQLHASSYQATRRTRKPGNKNTQTRLSSVVRGSHQYYTIKVLLNKESL